MGDYSGSNEKLPYFELFEKLNLENIMKNMTRDVSNLKFTMDNVENEI